MNRRNGYRELDTRIGTLERRIPKLSSGSYFPSFLEPRKGSEQALVVVRGVPERGSTRKFDELVQPLGVNAGVIFPKSGEVKFPTPIWRPDGGSRPSGPISCGSRS